ncbi:MAG TPA: D-aminoacylase [bacterium]|nr:D-aminoacylase [bacterium]
MADMILIRGGRIYDGSGSAAFDADVLIEGDRIKDVGPAVVPEKAAGDPGIEEIDASGKIVCPGFIDMHAHSDFKIAVDGSMAPKLRQGVTSVVMGSCGFSAAPVNDLMRRDYRRFLTGMFGDECAFEWSTLSGYLNRIRKQGTGTNVYPQVGMGNLRSMVMGVRPSKANEWHIKKMKMLLEQSLEEGARGFSTGLVYPMQLFASHHEVMELCRVAARHGALYSTHIRNEMDRSFDANCEAVQFARETGVSVQISHQKAVKQSNWGAPKRSLEMMEQAREQGIDVETDAYPYDSFSNIFLLTVVINEPGREEKIIFIDLKNLPQYEGKTLADVMRDTGKSALAASLYILKEEGLTKVPIAGRFICEDDLRYILAHPLVSIGSDGVEPQTGKKSHPRLYSTTARFLKKYVIEEKIVPMEEAIRKMTSMPARKAGIEKRGLLEAGNFADVVVFDPAGLKDNATYSDPMVHPDGFDAVIVNGRTAVRNDELLDVRAGVVL